MLSKVKSLLLLFLVQEAVPDSTSIETKQIYFMVYFFCSPPTKWTEQHDVSLCREAFAAQPFQWRPKTQERGQAWTKIA